MVRPDELDAVVLAMLSEDRVLRKETVSCSHQPQTQQRASVCKHVQRSSPGWMASTLFSTATLTIPSMSRYAPTAVLLRPTMNA